MSDNEKEVISHRDFPPEIANGADEPDSRHFVNVLTYVSKQELLFQVEQFTKENGLEEHTEAFKKGALLAQRPRAWDLIEELTPEEKATITHEHQHKWQQPFSLYFIGRFSPSKWALK